MSAPDPAACDVERFFEHLSPAWSTARLAGHAGLHLVVAPHPDDDVIGAGGIMALLGRARRPVVVLYVTTGAPAARDACAIVRTRRSEALAALRIVRARSACFLPFTSGDVRTLSRRVRSALMDVIELLRPVSIYLPCPFERHATHRVVTRLTVSALRGSHSVAGELWGYSVWGTLPVSSLVRTVDISSVADLKRNAIEQHRSQATGKDYAEGMLGLNRYAAVFNSIRPGAKQFRFAEQFLDMRVLLQQSGLSLERFASRALARSMAQTAV